MNPTIICDERVSVVILFHVHTEPSSIAQPYKMRYKNRDVTFTQLGLRHPTAKGKRMIHVFDVSDGCDDYRLEFDAEALTWTLTAIIPGGST
ncbi:hypothetical protein IPL85_03815 [Candidatus Saccharibacteria bacterium]|nr:MAG: hypothetical protein IPL85_03815 [Candidatus Saccharibacteria bacterium]